MMEEDGGMEMASVSGRLTREKKSRRQTEKTYNNDLCRCRRCSNCCGCDMMCDRWTSSGVCSGEERKSYTME